jgi:hypothetical protein
MQHRRILVASPIEPSGASWLLNCFLELGIRVDHKPVTDRIWRGSAPAAEPGRMWMAADDGRFSLNPKAGVLMKFLPSLARRDTFRFRGDVSVGYVQDLPPRDIGGDARILFVRDPRDALYSSFRRIAPGLDFAEFLRFPNPVTLLGRCQHWTLFAASWLQMPGIHVTRFEDYKRDAQATLRAVLSGLDLTYGESEIAEAARLSSFEQARDAERIVRDRFPHDRQVANRAGAVAERRAPDIEASLPVIERATASVLQALGYDAQATAAPDPFAAARLSAAFLAVFATLYLPDALGIARPYPADPEDGLPQLLAFARQLDSSLLGRASLPPAEACILLDSLVEYSTNHATFLARRLRETRSSFSDGSGYFFQKIREMRQSGSPST